MSEAMGRRRRRAAVRGGRRSLGIRMLRVVVWTVSSALLLGCGATWYAYHTLISGLTTSDALDAVRKKAPPRLDDAVNLLLIGLDSRKDMNGNDLPRKFVQRELHAGSSSIGYYNTNTLILMHIPAGGGRVQAFSIPRDDYVQTLNGDGSVQGHYKIKEAYANAYTGAHDRYARQGVEGAELEARSREAGREATLATVQDFSGVPIDHFAEVNLLGFYDIAKVLQPITVCLNHPVQDRYSGADFPAGVQRLNARQALAFVRQRHGLDAGDLDRTRRQQAFISSVTHQLKSQGVWSSPSKLQGLFDTVKKDIVLDTSWNVLDFAQQATNLTGGNVVFHTLPIEGFATRNGQDVNLVDPAKIKAMVRQEFGATPSPTAGAAGTAAAAPATVDVRNGNGAEGEASAALSYLAELGYTAGTTGNVAAQPATTVLYGPGAQQAAQQIAGHFNAAAPAAGSAVPAGHVLVTLGESYALPSRQAPSPAATEPSSSSPADSGPAVKAGGVPCVN